MHFSFGGGFPFNGQQGSFGSRGRPEPTAVNNTELYVLLQCEKDATADQIKRQYKVLARTNHPDKGGDPEKFKKISRAYEVLSDPNKRRIYDKHGEEGLEAGGGGGGGENGDLLETLFFGGGSRRGDGKRKGEDLQSEITCTLEQLYKGRTRKLQINRDALCKVCGGTGGEPDAVTECEDCKGQGVRVIVQQVGPMIMQQSRSTCPTCRGNGRVVPPSKRCKAKCDEGSVKEKKLLEVYVPPGTSEGKKIVFQGESDHRPGETPGDVIFVVKELSHPIFTRKGNNLGIVKQTTLYEALTGVKFVIKHLDDRKLVITTAQGEVLTSRCVKVVEGEGMPNSKNRALKGNLLIEFEVKFPLPAQLDDAKRKDLKKCLPLPEPQELPAEDDLEVDYYTLTDFSAQKHTQDKSGDKEAYDEDDDEVAGRQEIGCRTQ